MSSFERAVVTGIAESREGVQEIKLRMPDGSEAPAIVLTALIGPVDEGDEVVANTTAVELQLGSGGYHFVLWNTSRSSITAGPEGHIMKLRYTPLQFNVQAVEEGLDPEPSGRDLGSRLKGMPVVAGSLHSQLLAVAVAYRDRAPDGRLVYIMTDGGSLPMAFSRTVGFLKESGLVNETISCGHAFGGDREAVNLYGALLSSREICGADAVVVLMGPGIVGTGTAVGFTGMEQAAVVNAAGSLGAEPIAIPRITFSDERERHRGLSHHTVSVLGLGAKISCVVPVPALEGDRRELVWAQLEESGITTAHRVVEVDARDVPSLIERCGFEPTVMGRSVAREPEFFSAAGAAGILAARERE